jgi:hypothetical protein
MQEPEQVLDLDTLLSHAGKWVGEALKSIEVCHRARTICLAHRPGDDSQLAANRFTIAIMESVGQSRRVSARAKARGRLNESHGFSRQQRRQGRAFGDAIVVTCVSLKRFQAIRLCLEKLFGDELAHYSVLQEALQRVDACMRELKVANPEVIMDAWGRLWHGLTALKAILDRT